MMKWIDDAKRFHKMDTYQHQQYHPFDGDTIDRLIAIAERAEWANYDGHDNLYQCPLCLQFNPRRGGYKHIDINHLGHEKDCPYSDEWKGV